MDAEERREIIHTALVNYLSYQRQIRATVDYKVLPQPALSKIRILIKEFAK